MVAGCSLPLDSDDTPTSAGADLPNRLLVQALLGNHTATVTITNESINQTVIDQTYFIEQHDRLNFGRELNEGTAYHIAVTVPEGIKTRFRLDETETQTTRLGPNGKIIHNTLNTGGEQEPGARLNQRSDTLAARVSRSVRSMDAERALVRPSDTTYPIHVRCRVLNTGCVFSERDPNPGSERTNHRGHVSGNIAGERTWDAVSVSPNPIVRAGSAQNSI